MSFKWWVQTVLLCLGAAYLGGIIFGGATESLSLGLSIAPATAKQIGDLVGGVGAASIGLLAFELRRRKSEA
jgi:hypothetical protein